MRLTADAWAIGARPHAVPGHAHSFTDCFAHAIRDGRAQLDRQRNGRAQRIADRVGLANGQPFAKRLTITDGHAATRANGPPWLHDDRPGPEPRRDRHVGELRLLPANVW